MKNPKQYRMLKIRNPKWFWFFKHLNFGFVWDLRFGILDFRRKRFGFTLLDLAVSTGVIVIIFSFVLANLRTGERSGELDITIKKVVSNISSVRNMSLGGQIIDGSFPEGGYGVFFDTFDPEQLILFAISSEDGSWDEDDILPQGQKEFYQVKLIGLYGLDSLVVTDSPCEVGSNWQYIGDDLEIIFTMDDQIQIIPENSSLDYVGGVIEHKKTNKKAYFYVSLISGLISGDVCRGVL